MLPSAEDIIDGLNNYRVKLVEIEEGYELQVTKTDGN